MASEPDRPKFVNSTSCPTWLLEVFESQFQEYLDLKMQRDDTETKKLYLSILWNLILVLGIKPRPRHSTTELHLQNVA